MHIYIYIYTHISYKRRRERERERERKKTKRTTGTQILSVSMKTPQHVPTCLRELPHDCATVATAMSGERLRSA